MKPGTSYVIGYEPHSALPVGIPSVFSTPSPRLPKFLARSNFHSLASGVCFLVPFVRQLWWWLVRQRADHTIPFPPSIHDLRVCLHLPIPLFLHCHFLCCRPAGQWQTPFPPFASTLCPWESNWPRCYALHCTLGRGWLVHAGPGTSPTFVGPRVPYPLAPP